MLKKLWKLVVGYKDVYTVTATLLIIKAAIEDDQNLVLKLYGEDIQGLLQTKVPLKEKDNFTEVQHCVLNGHVNLSFAMEIAQKNNSFAVRELLLLRTGINRCKRVVSWSGLHLTQVEISLLEKILWIKDLLLSDNKLISLPLKIGGYLKHCNELNLQNNLLSEVPLSLLKLPCIIKLNLSHNKIVKIPNVQVWSNSLTVLDLSYNCLRSLPNNSIGAPSLQNLNISHNQFRTVPQCICSFTGLTMLNISYNSQITTLPFELGQLKNICVIDFSGLNFKNIPLYICLCQHI